jgi:hypothetical protein
VRCLAALDGLVEDVAAPRFVRGRLARIVVAPAASALPPLPLLCAAAEFVDPWVAAFHADATPRPVHALCCYTVGEAVISGRGHVFLEDALVTAPEFMPLYWRRMVDSGEGADPAGEYALPTRRIEEPCLCVLGHGLQVYGHFLLEMLPRLHLARRTLAGVLPPWRVLLDRAAPAWLLAILRDCYGIDEDAIAWFDPRSEKLVLRQAILPALASADGVFHPAASALFDEIVAMAGGPAGAAAGCSAEAMAGGPAPARLFVSRAGFANPHSFQRCCVNAAELAAIAAEEFAMTVLAPQGLDWRGQIRAFAAARVVVGEYGSGLHNALFAPAGCAVGALGILALDQSHIATLRRQRSAYLRALPDGSPWRTRVDPALFRRLLAGLLS